MVQIISSTKQHHCLPSDGCGIHIPTCQRNYFSNDRDFLDRNIEHTKCIVNYIRPLLSLVDPQVESFIAKLRTVTYQLPHTFFSRSECEYYFALSWLITWFSHDVDNAEDVCRITDFLLSSHPLMPVYLSVTVQIILLDQ